MTPDVAALDAMPAGEFVAAVAPLFEGAPGFLWRLAAARPFESQEMLFERARGIAHGMPEPLQVELVDALAERAAAELDRLNDAYEARFGFRYCVFVSGRSRAALLPDMAAALERERDSELQRALDAVVDIAEARSRA